MFKLLFSIIAIKTITSCPLYCNINKNNVNHDIRIIPSLYAILRAIVIAKYNVRAYSVYYLVYGFKGFYFFMDPGASSVARGSGVIIYINMCKCNMCKIFICYQVRIVVDLSV